MGSLRMALSNLGMTFVLFTGISWRPVQGHNSVHSELCIPAPVEGCSAVPIQSSNSTLWNIQSTIDSRRHPVLMGLPGKVKILPLGDSLTKGQVFMKCSPMPSGKNADKRKCDGSTSYRYFLGLHLQASVPPWPASYGHVCKNPQALNAISCARARGRENPQKMYTRRYVTFIRRHKNIVI
jgi:hypothetical protein